MIKEDNEAPVEIACEKKNGSVTFECHCKKRWRIALPEDRKIVTCQCKNCGKPYRITIRLPRAEERIMAEGSDKVWIRLPGESRFLSCRILNRSDGGLQIEALGALRKKLQVKKIVFVRLDPHSDDISEFKVCWMNGLYVGLHLKGQTQHFVQQFTDLADSYQDPWKKANSRFL